MNLVIVESPAKGRTIEKYLGKDYKVLASFGHVRDLPTKTLGVDIKKDFEPTYVIPNKAKKVVSKLKDEISQADELYLATDYDREGEAIAWHIIQACGLGKLKTNRITFHEVTKPAIEEAIKHPRDINFNLVDAQQARRILDRLVGYKLSPFLWKKVAQGLSAGRVQSVAVRLIVEKEREIKQFKLQEYWTVEALLSKDKNQFKAILTEQDGKKIGKLEIQNQKEAQKIIGDLENADYIIAEIKKEEKKKYPAPPFTTSTLQQEAGAKLHFSAKQTMRLAQNLYEDGLITYMRTDSVQVSPIALRAVVKVIGQKFGPQYALPSPRFYKTKTKGAQEAHEAIRPTNLELAAEKIHLTDAHIRLYDLIWKKMIASQMKEATVDETNLKIKAKNFGFSATGSKIKFDGFLKIYPSKPRLGFAETGKNGLQENILPLLEIGDKLNLDKLERLQHFTEPPPRYTEGSLIKELEKRGIGRPSTYAPTISTIQERGYVEKIEGKFIPKDIGEAVNNLLVEHFPEIVDYNFTAKMEEELDEIAEGKLKWRPVIKEFYEPFSKQLANKMVTVQKNDLEKVTSEKCPNCGKNLVEKFGRYGKFLACSGFPDCKFTKPIIDQKDTGQKLKQKPDEKCPKCGKNLVLKESRFGPFSGCEGYPKCRFTKNIEIKSDVKCPNCNGDLIQKRTRKGRTFWGCKNYPKCKTAFWQEPTQQKCAKCGSLMLGNINSKLRCSKCQ